MPKAIGSQTGRAIAALFMLLSPASVAAQSHQGLVSISAVSTLGGSALREWDARVDRMIRENELVLRAAYDDRSVPDRRHERLSQYYRGVPGSSARPALPKNGTCPNGYNAQGNYCVAMSIT